MRRWPHINQIESGLAHLYVFVKVRTMRPAVTSGKSGRVLHESPPLQKSRWASRGWPYVRVTSAASRAPSATCSTRAFNQRLGS